MKTETYFAIPVEAVRVTKDNMKEVAEWCGGRIFERESKKVPGQIDEYVWVPTPRKATISWAYPGMYVTKQTRISSEDKVTVTWAVFQGAYFMRNYFLDASRASQKMR